MDYLKLSDLVKQDRDFHWSLIAIIMSFGRLIRSYEQKNQEKKAKQAQQQELEISWNRNWPTKS